MKFLLAVYLVMLLFASVLGVQKDAVFEGTIVVTETRGTSPTHFLFTRGGQNLRIEETDNNGPEPINIVDLSAQKLTIVYPHNSSFVVIDLIRQLPDQAQSGANLPPGFPTPLNPVGQAGGFPGDDSVVPGNPEDVSATRVFRARPRCRQCLTTPWPPAIPKMPIGGAPIDAGGPPALPNPGIMPSMPTMGSFGGTPELKKTDKTKKIQELDCTCYTLSDRMETFEIWATSDAALFRFRLHEVNYHTRHFGPQMLEQQWVGLLRKQSLFPAGLRLL
jgi:hypothetical protein